MSTNSDPATETTPTRDSLLHSLAAARVETVPYRHWLRDDVLDASTHEALLALPIAAPKPDSYDGTREGNNSSRSYFNPEACAVHAACRRVVEAFRDPAVIDRLQATCDVDLSQGQLHVENCQDRGGFWLEPHTDIGVKLFTMLIYLSREAELADAGTDIYDGELRHVKTAPFAANHGLIFIPGADTWHGFAPRPIRGLRRSLIVNYVAPAWRERWQLA